ncbi:CU044_2847 family protein [Nocardioides sp. NPDC057577]|uniref:CU044_2847 family protein n=1 Tax=Nocardioides sp. NPDC057577 TaxID=3346171 RepID=UPI00366C0620
MDYTPVQIGTSTILIESSDDGPGAEVDWLGDEFGTTETSSRLEDAYGSLKRMLQDVSADLGSALATSPDGPSSVSLELAFSLTGSAGLWVMKAQGQGSVKATLTWDFDRS